MPGQRRNEAGDAPCGTGKTDNDDGDAVVTMAQKRLAKRETKN